MSDILSVEDTLAKVLLSIRAIRPFYSAIYESLERVETEHIDTMGVTCNKLLYNKKFIQGLTIEELKFVNLHEIVHVALMHVSRRKKRDAKLWNIACDLYDNKLLAEEFQILPGETSNAHRLTMPKDLCWCGTLDLETDTVDNIYNHFYEQGTKNGYFSDKLNLSDKELEMKEYEFSYTGTAEKSYKDSSSGTFTYKINVLYVGDLSTDGGDDDLMSENENKRILSEALTRSKLTNAGSTPGLLEIRVGKILESHINWKKWLQKYCIQCKSSDSSFNNPDKRMFYQDAIYPGQEYNISGELRNIKICIDTSGSISEEDLKYIYGQVLSLSKYYKVTAEVIAWDCSCASCGMIGSHKDITNIDLVGGGGTDPSCVFEYFDSKECKIKPYVTLMFTDGYWDMSNEKSNWKRKYKDTLWVLTRDANGDFTPPFGLVTEVKYAK